MKIGVAGDHAGYEYKNRLAELLTKKGHDVADYGTYSDVSCDYPDYAHALAEAVQKKEVEVGIAICGTGNGMAITLNVLVLPARFISYQMATRIVNTWLSTPAEGGRHERRREKIDLK